MSELRLVSTDLADLDALARKLADFGAAVPVWLLEGSMGAGKTTLIQALCRHWDVVGPVQSPTFSLVNEYETAAGEVLYHFDLYRLKTETEALDFGIEEYFDSGRRCLVEWPSQIPSLLPSDALTIFIEVDANGHRPIWAQAPQLVTPHS
jgi:tRNA threonylcarbamoyladenosine biosynthesis protein TsaE